MDTTTLVYIAAAYFIASFVKGATGLGFSTTCMPIMALQLNIAHAIPLVVIPSIISNLILMRQIGYFHEAVNRFKWIYIAVIPGLLIGMTILTAVPTAWSKGALGTILIIYAIWALGRKQGMLSTSAEQYLKIPTGFLTGFINGLTGSQVMPIMPYLLALELPKNLFIQAINISFTLSSFTLLAGLSRLGYMDMTTAIIATAGLVPVYLGIKAGGLIQKRLSDNRYRQIILIFLMVLGMILLIKLF